MVSFHCPTSVVLYFHYTVQLKEQLQAIQTKKRQLLQENAALHGVVGCLELAARQQSHVNRVLQRLHPLFDDTGAPALQTAKVFSIKELLRLLPLSVVSTIAPTADKHLHRSVMTLTPATAAQHWGQAVSDLRLLLYLHSRDPIAAQGDLSICINELTRWSCAVYMFNPSVLQQLADVNLQTMQHAAAPAEHWKAAWELAALNDIQRRQILAVKRFLTPKLLNLDAERRQLATELADLDAAATNHPSARSSGSNSGNSGGSDRGTSSSGSIEQCRWDTAQQLARVNNAWRVLTQLRSQLVVAILEPWQAARIVVNVYPYMLLGGPLYKHLDPEPVVLPCASGTGDQVAAATAAAAEAVAVMPGLRQLDATEAGDLPAGMKATRALGLLGSTRCLSGGVFGSREFLVGGSVVGDNYTSM